MTATTSKRLQAVLEAQIEVSSYETDWGPRFVAQLAGVEGPGSRASGYPTETAAVEALIGSTTLKRFKLTLSDGKPEAVEGTGRP